MGKNSGIGSWNWISSAPKLAHLQPEHSGKLVLGENSVITMRHYLDCSGGVLVGDFVTIAGVRSTFLTHQIDVVLNEQTASPVRIGSYALVSSNCSIVAGATIGEACLVGMGTVVLGKTYPDSVLLAGNPARVVREQTGAYFTRNQGAVSPPEKYPS
jgi:acetyltransferase-like isoleucine patch superfamily enzyme